MNKKECVKLIAEIISNSRNLTVPSDQISSYIVKFLEGNFLITFKEDLTNDYIDLLCDRLLEYTDQDEYTIASIFLGSKNINEFMDCLTNGEDARYVYEVFKRIEDIEGGYVIAKEAQYKGVV